MSFLLASYTIGTKGPSRQVGNPTKPLKMACCEQVEQIANFRLDKTVYFHPSKNIKRCCCISLKITFRELKMLNSGKTFDVYSRIGNNSSRYLTKDCLPQKYFLQTHTPTLTWYWLLLGTRMLSGACRPPTYNSLEVLLIFQNSPMTFKECIFV